MSEEVADVKGHEDLLRRCERVVKFQENIEELREDLKKEWHAAKGVGYDLRAMRRVIKEMRADKDKRDEQLQFDLVVDSYRAGVGLVTAAEISGRPKPEFVAPEPPQPKERRGRAADEPFYEVEKLDYETRKQREKAAAKAKADKYLLAGA